MIIEAYEAFTKQRTLILLSDKLLDMLNNPLEALVVDQGKLSMDGVTFLKIK